MANVSWNHIGSALLVIAAFVAIAVVARANKGRLALIVTRFIAFVYLAVTGLAAAVNVVNIFTTAPIRVAMPVTEFWPTVLPGASFDGLQAKVVGGGFSVASVDVAGLDMSTRFWLAGSQLLQGATGVIVAIVVIQLCTNLLRQSPFQPALIRGINLSAVTVIIGGILWQLCSAIGGTLASSQVLHWSSGVYLYNSRHLDSQKIYGLPEWATGSINIDLWPIGIGIALLAVAAAFRYGERLQKDLEGLV